MFFLIVLCLIVLCICISVIKDSWTTMNAKARTVVVLVTIAATIGLGASIGGYIANNSGSSSKTKYSQLSDREKANAKWAYEAQQAVNDAKKSGKYN